jgi:hypothetical protein
VKRAYKLVDVFKGDNSELSRFSFHRAVPVFVPELSRFSFCRAVPVFVLSRFSSLPVFVPPGFRPSRFSSLLWIPRGNASIKGRGDDMDAAPDGVRQLLNGRAKPAKRPAAIANLL